MTGILVFNDSYTTTLTAPVTYKQPCEASFVLGTDGYDNTTVLNGREPFYTSISPQVYALACATVISYMLVILIFITPRTFFVGGPGGGAGFLGSRGVIPGSYGSSSVVGIGRRPLLQKIATITVAASLTIATADTFKVARKQYDHGYTDSSLLVDDVVGSIEIRVVRIISDTFLWLAQVQTLIRLFPRHKEKVTIKWLGFALITLDTIFSILDSFVSNDNKTKPRKFEDAIPALSYLFELAISLIYASCVIYYSLSKRRFAFWHLKMKNVCLVALLSLVAVLIPIVFFVTDIAQPNVAGWGEYIGWVGSAAASVVVWEWVERIEALERDERKDGILGREVFDGDEMLDMTPSPGAGRRQYFGDDGGSERSASGATKARGMRARFRRLQPRMPLARGRRLQNGKNASNGEAHLTVSSTSGIVHIAVPPTAATPVSRSHTTSAASTVYAIRYHDISSPSPVIPEEQVQTAHNGGVAAHTGIAGATAGRRPSTTDDDSLALQKVLDEGGQQQDTGMHRIWQTVPNPFKRKRAEPPAEVAGAQAAVGNFRKSPTERSLNIRNRIEALASLRTDRFRSRGSVGALPVTVIPAPTAGRTWSPDELRASRGDGPSMHEGYHGTTMQTEETNTTSHGRRDGTVVIPAPFEGQRTWSPNDLHAAQQEATSRAGDSRSTTTQSPGARRRFTTPARENGIPVDRTHDTATPQNQFRSTTVTPKSLTVQHEVEQSSTQNNVILDANESGGTTLGRTEESPVG